MRNLFFKIVVVTLIFNSSYLLASSSVARQVFLNGSIHTFNKQLEIIEAISIKDGVIEQIGSNDEIKKIIEKTSSLISSFKPVMKVPICGNCGLKDEKLADKCPVCKSPFII